MVWLPDWKWKQQQAQKKGGATKGASKGEAWKPKWEPKKPAWTPKTWTPKTWTPQFQKWGGKGGKGGKGWRRRKGNDPNKTIWVGGLPDGATYQALKDHGAQAGETKWAECYKNKGKGTGAIGYATAEEAAAAVGLLNGSIFGGSQITADSWEKQQK
mmetsp:Transcript_6796/g.10969  ORF Transcript_6796/g.10969 Transcript_6796/m.10969 type:complete len:157 (-) Transcript_6796:41-511(-)